MNKMVVSNLRIVLTSDEMVYIRLFIMTFC